MGVWNDKLVCGGAACGALGLSGFLTGFILPWVYSAFSLRNWYFNVIECALCIQLHSCLFRAASCSTVEYGAE